MSNQLYRNVNQIKNKLKKKAHNRKLDSIKCVASTILMTEKIFDWLTRYGAWRN